VRLKPDEIKKLGVHCANQVFADPKNQFKVARAQIQDTVLEVIRTHFEEERRIEEEAERLLKDRQEEFAGIQRAKAFGMIKAQIANEKDYILSGGQGARMSDDKISHLSHLIADKLYDDDLMDFPDEDDGPKFFKKVLTTYFGLEDQIDEKVRKKINSLSSPPMEHSKDWEVLYKKYCEEEKRRLGHD